MPKDYNSAIKLTGKILDAWLPWKLKYGRVPGMAVGVVYRGKLVYANGFGYADVAGKKPVTPETCFRIASISKTFTAFALMQLVENGKLALDDKAAKYLPWFEAKNGNRSTGDVTIRRLLSHAAGVFRDGDTPHWEDDRFPDAVGLKRSIGAKTLVPAAHKKFKYSNFGFAILGQVIEVVSGMPYGEYVTKNIIKKLKMARTAPDADKRNIKWLAKGYSRTIPDERRFVFPNPATKAYMPATGFLSDVPDLAKYLAAWPLASGKLASRKSKMLMVRPVSKISDREKYGLGLRLWSVHGHKVVGHGGGFGGFITRVGCDPQNNIGVIVLTNGNSSPAVAVADSIFDMIYSFAEKKRKYCGTGTIRGAANCEGVYRSRWTDDIVVSLGGKLIVFEPNCVSPLKYALLLRPTSGKNFIIDTENGYDHLGEEAHFVFSKKGKKAKEFVIAARRAARV